MSGSIEPLATLPLRRHDLRTAPTTAAVQNDLKQASDDLVSPSNSGAAAEARTFAHSLIEGDPIPRS